MPEAADTCNLRDDICDGTVDNIPTGENVGCGVNVGVCKAGLARCPAGAFVCVGKIDPGVETCNGLDDNCDGVIDNNTPGEGVACGSAVGTCKTGTQHCQNATFVCQGSVAPVPETCNGLDDDCHGTADNNP